MTVREAMIVREVTTATATTIGDEARVHPRDVDYAAQAGLQVGVGVGAAALGLGTGVEDGHPREVHLHPRGSVVGSIPIHLHPVVLGDQGRVRLPLGGIHEATVPCRHPQGVVHPLLLVVTVVARLVAIAGRVHRQGLL